MSWSFKLFKIKGIDIKVHTLFILILVWAAYRLLTVNPQFVSEPQS